MNNTLPPDAAKKLQDKINNAGADELREMLINVTGLLNEEVEERKRITRLLEVQVKERYSEWSRNWEVKLRKVQWENYMKSNHISNY